MMVAVIHLDRRKKARTILRIGQRLPNKPEKMDRVKLPLAPSGSG